MSSKNIILSLDKQKVLNEHRYCNQKGFSVLVCGGRDKNGEDTNKVLEVKIPSFKVTEFHSIVKPHSLLRTTTINSKMIAIVDSTRVYKQLGSYRTSIEI